MAAVDDVRITRFTLAATQALRTFFVPWSNGGSQPEAAKTTTTTPATQRREQNTVCVSVPPRRQRRPNLEGGLHYSVALLGKEERGGRVVYLLLEAAANQRVSMLHSTRTTPLRAAPTYHTEAPRHAPLCSLSQRR